MTASRFLVVSLFLLAGIPATAPLSGGTFESLWGRDLVPLKRFYNAQDDDHWVTSVRFPNVGDTGFLYQATVAFARLEPALGMIKLRDCYASSTDDHFLSDDCAAEGGSLLRNLGWIWQTQQPGTIPFYRCFDVAAGDSSASTESDCEGQGTQDRILGYVDPITTTPSGWDYNLTRRCAKTGGELGSENYYEDLTDCAAGSLAHWSLGVHSEQGFGAGSCPGSVDSQSFLFNDGPVSIDWKPRDGGTRYMVVLKTDFQAETHPCGAEYFTWVVLMDSEAATLPPPDKSALSVTVNFNHWLVDPASTTRALVSWRGHWDGKFRVVTINLHETAGIGDNFPQEPDVETYRNTPDLETVRLNGEPLGIYVPDLLEHTPVRIDWYQILDDLIARGWLEAPTGSSPVEPKSIRVGHEAFNAAATNAVVSTLRVQEFRIEQVDY